jgi:hypothetical protein
MGRLGAMISVGLCALLYCGTCLAADSTTPLKSKPLPPLDKPKVLKPIDVGASGIKIESLKLVESAASCEWRYEITIRNAGPTAYTGTLGLNSFFFDGPNKVTGGSNVLNINNLAAGSTHAEIKPVSVASSSNYKKLGVNLTGASGLTDTKTIDLNLHYTAQIISASVESGSVRVAVKSTSAVAAKFFFSVYRPDPTAQGGWAAAGGRGFCLAPGQTFTDGSPAPSGWPNNPNVLKVTLKSGPDVLGEKTISATGK